MHKITVPEFYAMGAAGIFDPKIKLELIGGQLVRRMPRKPPHRITKNAITASFAKTIIDGWCVWAEAPILLGEHDLPRPDVFVSRGVHQDYPDNAPTPRDVALVVDVAASRPRSDRGPKLCRYAAAGIPVHWIADVVARRIDVRFDPIGGGDDAVYQTTRTYLPGGEVPVVVDGREVVRLAVDSLLPRSVEVLDAPNPRA